MKLTIFVILGLLSIIQGLHGFRSWPLRGPHKDTSLIIADPKKGEQLVFGLLFPDQIYSPRSMDTYKPFPNRHIPRLWSHEEISWIFGRCIVCVTLRGIQCCNQKG